MKKSSCVPASLIVALAATVSVTGCASDSEQCVDSYGNTLSSSDCSSGRVYGAHWVNRGGFGGYSGTSGGFYGG